MSRPRFDRTPGKELSKTEKYGIDATYFEFIPYVFKHEYNNYDLINGDFLYLLDHKGNLFRTIAFVEYAEESPYLTFYMVGDHPAEYLTELMLDAVWVRGKDREEFTRMMNHIIK